MYAWKLKNIVGSSSEALDHIWMSLVKKMICPSSNKIAGHMSELPHENLCQLFHQASLTIDVCVLSLLQCSLTGGGLGMEKKSLHIVWK